MKIGSLFSGYGGLDLAVESLLDAETVWHCEWDDAPARILEHHWPGVPNFRDVSLVDWSTVEPIDILTGGFPCQDVSLAGARRGLRDGTRSGLWSEFARAIEELKPRLVVIENVRGLLSATANSDVEPCPWCLGEADGEHALRALGAVLGDLASLGFDAEWGNFRASDAGAPHRRERIFIIAWPANSDGFGPVHGWFGIQPANNREPSQRDAGSGVSPEGHSASGVAADPDRESVGEHRRESSAEEAGQVESD